MNLAARRSAIVGVYTTEQARGLARTSISLQIEAVKGALADAGLSPADVDGVVPMDPNPVPNSASAHMFWAEQLGERTLTFMETGIASGAIAKAAVNIAAGMANVVVLVYGKAGPAVGTDSPRRGEWGTDLHGADAASWHAMWTRRYLHEFGYTETDLAAVPVTHRYHATLNPDSVTGRDGEITVEDVVTSPYVAEPIHQLDCSIENDGGYAIVVASASVAHNCRTRPIWILGGAEAAHTDSYMTAADPWFPETGASVRRAADAAFAMAGVTRADIDVAGLDDSFSVTMVRDLEELGFCALGDGARYFQEGHTRIGGAMPCNTDGGLLSNSHVADSSGLPTIEVVRQLRGECGARQVPNATVGLSSANGHAVHGRAGTLIMAVQ